MLEEEEDEVPDSEVHRARFGRDFEKSLLMSMFWLRPGRDFSLSFTRALPKLKSRKKRGEKEKKRKGKKKEEGKKRGKTDS